MTPERKAEIRAMQHAYDCACDSLKADSIAAEMCDAIDELLAELDAAESRIDTIVANLRKAGEAFRKGEKPADPKTPRWIKRPSGPGIYLCWPGLNGGDTHLVALKLSQEDIDRGAPFASTAVYGPIPEPSTEPPPCES